MNSNDIIIKGILPTASTTPKGVTGDYLYSEWAHDVHVCTL